MALKKFEYKQDPRDLEELVLAAADKGRINALSKKMEELNKFLLK